MKKVFVSIMVALMSGLMMVPTMDAQSRSRGGNSGDRSSMSGTRPGRGNGGSNSATRPGNSGNNGNHSGNNGNNGNHGGGSTATRPGNSGNNGNHSGNNWNNGNHGNVTTPGRPGGVATPGRPGTTQRPPVMAAPSRPGRPQFSPWVRPTPPTNWRPAYRYPLINNVLGLSFGWTINTALDHLYSGGYTVDGYGTQEVYLRNVRELGYSWDDATLYFNNTGMVRSQFYELSGSYNLSRYNGVYSMLCSQYGAPVTQYNNGSTLTATWFGYTGDYVTLEYKLLNSSMGYRYYTILTYGS